MKRNTQFILSGLSSKEYSSRGLMGLFLAYFGILGMTALLTPLVYWGIQWMAVHWPSATVEYLAGKSIRKFFDRLFFIQVIILIPIAFSILRLGSFKKLGISLSSQGVREWVKGILLGVGLLGGVVILQMLVGAVTLKESFTFSSLPGIIFKALLASVLIAAIEEIVFRGFLLRLFYAAFKPQWAVMGCALFFAWVHFRMPGGIWDESQTAVHAWSGFFIAKHTLLGFFHDFDIISFINLALLGCLLGVLYLRHGSLMQAIGVHGGMVFMMMVYKKMVEVDPLGNVLWIGTREMTDGVLPTLLLMGVLFYFRKVWVKEDSRS